MPTYLHKLYMMQRKGEVYVSCTDLAEYINIELIVVRKDIALTGLAGHRRLGYKIDELIEAIRRYIGLDKPIPATLIGAGALGAALLGYEDFSVYGLEIKSVFDIDPAKIGTHLHGYEVSDIAFFHDRTKPEPPKMGIICVSSIAAQWAADLLVSVGVRYIWNFANVCLHVPKGVVVQREVIAGGLAVLAAKMRLLESGEMAEFD